MDLSNIREHFQWLVDDDTLDTSRENILANQAYDRLMTKHRWNFLNDNDSSNTVASATTSYSLPSDFLLPTMVRLYDSSEDTYQELRPVSYKDRLDYYEVDNYYYIDEKNSNLVLTATPDSSIIGNVLHIDYQYQPAQLSADTDSPVFNRAFHPIVALEMARFYFYNDQGEKSRAWNTEMKTEYNEMLAEMKAWDSRFDGVMNQNILSNAISPYDDV